MTRSFIIFVVLLLIALYIYIRSALQNIDLKFQFDEVDLSGLGGLEQIDKGEGFVRVKLNFFLTYYGLFDITIKDLKINIYHNNQIVAKSSDTLLNNQKIYLKTNEPNLIKQDFDIAFTGNTISLIAKIKNKGSYQIKYDISLKTLGIPFTFNKTINK